MWPQPWRTVWTVTVDDGRITPRISSVQTRTNGACHLVTFPGNGDPKSFVEGVGFGLETCTRNTFPPPGAGVFLGSRILRVNPAFLRDRQPKSAAIC